MSADPPAFIDSFIKRMDGFRRKGKFCDTRLIAKGSDRNEEERKEHVKNAEFLVHSNVLAAASAHFELVFDAGLKETEINTVELDMDSDVLEKLVFYMYAVKIDIDMQWALLLLPEAAYLQLSLLLAACETCLVSNVTASNCLKLWHYARRFDCNDLKMRAWKAACNNIDTLATTDDLLALDYLDFVSLVSEKYLFCKESSLYTAIMQWVKASKFREKHLPSLLSQVRLSCLQPKFLTRTVGKEPLIRQNGACFDMFLEALESLSSQFDLTNAARDRNTLNVPWNVSSTEWSCGPDLDDFNAYLKNVQAIGNVLYCVTAAKNGKSKALNLTTGKWDDMASPAKVDSDCFLSSSEQFIYLVESRYESKVKIQKYCPRNNIWTILDGIGVEDDEYNCVRAVASIGNSVYICCQNAIHVLENDSICTKLTDLPFESSCYEKMVALHGELYVGNENEGQVYNIARNQWRPGPKFNSYSKFASCDDGYIVELMGPDTGSKTEFKCFHNGEWKEIPALPASEKEIKGVRNVLTSVGNTLFVLGVEHDRTCGQQIICIMKVFTLVLHETSFQQSSVTAEN